MDSVADPHTAPNSGYHVHEVFHLSMTRLVAPTAAFLLGLALSCDGSVDDSHVYASSTAVTDSTPDMADPAVVGIVAADDATELLCSGTVIAERVVLTAAHCNVQDDIESFAVYFGERAGDGGSVVPIVDAVAHPGFDGTARHDLALLLLGAPAPAPAVRPLEAPQLDMSPPVKLRLVGFGATSPDANDADRKREGWTQATEVYDLFVVLGPNPSLPCSGDSGGPAFAQSGAQERLAAVVSRGDDLCSEYGKATRVDAHLDSFIAPYLAATAVGAAGDGDACFYDEQCAGVRCIEAADEPLLRYCSRSCDGTESCPTSMSCLGGVCRYRIPSPGAIGSPCREHDECLRGDCLDEGFCSVRCVRGHDDCPSGYECTYLGSVDFFCMPTDPPPAVFQLGGGCATSHPARMSDGRLLLALLAMIACAFMHRRA